MALVAINWNPDTSDLRKFGAAMLVGGAAICGILLCQQHEKAAIICAAVVGAVGVLGLTGTPAAKLVYFPWMALAFLIGTPVSYCLLALVFLLIVTPTGIVMRLTGRDRLQLKGRSADTFWRSAQTSRSGRYERQS